MNASHGLLYSNLTRVTASFLFLYATSCYAQVDSSAQGVRSEQQVMEGLALKLDLGAQLSESLATLESESLATPESKAIAAAIADGVTTNLALSVGAVETNPLILTSPLGLVALTGMKIGLVKFAATLPESEKRFTLKSSSAIWGGAAVNNLIVLLAPPPFPIIAGLIMGIATWMNMGSRYEKEDQLLAARNKKATDTKAQTASNPEQLNVADSN
jgi:hypothetical protein